MTDNEIIKALEDMIKFASYVEDIETLSMVLDLITRQKAEIERLEYQKECLEATSEFQAKTIEQQSIIITCQKEEIDMLHSDYTYKFVRKKAKAESIKEFVSEFEYEIIHDEFWNKHIDVSQTWLNGYEQCRRDMRVMLNDKLKEMGVVSNGSL